MEVAVRWDGQRAVGAVGGGGATKEGHGRERCNVEDGSCPSQCAFIIL